MKNDFVIIASGASLTDQDVRYVFDRRNKCEVIVINDNYKKAPWADYLYFCDHQWYLWHKYEVDEFKGITATLAKNTKADWEFKQGYEEGLSFHPSYLHTGKNSGYQAINLACLMGANNIFLLGYDMQYTNGKSHWFGKHRGVGDNANHYDEIFQKMIKCFDTMVPDLRRFGTRVINCSRNTALQTFPIRPINEVLF